MNDININFPHDEILLQIAKAQQGDDAALNEAVNMNIALVKSIVRRFISRGAEYDDLFQIGCIGLIKAIRNFDASFNVKFSTYAVPMIAGELKRFLRDDGMVKVSRSIKEIAIKAMAVKSKLSNELGREVTVLELSKELGIDSEDLSAALDAMRPTVSIYEQAQGTDGEVMVLDRICDTSDVVGESLNRVMLKELMDDLDYNEQQLICMRYYMDKTQQQIAKELGISQVQVSRLEGKILKKMRDRAN